MSNGFLERKRPKNLRIQVFCNMTASWGESKERREPPYEAETKLWESQILLQFFSIYARSSCVEVVSKHEKMNTRRAMPPPYDDSHAMLL
jgi:hypothetical protein